MNRKQKKCKRLSRQELKLIRFCRFPANIMCLWNVRDPGAGHAYSSSSFTDTCATSTRVSPIAVLN
jgi:hypothetical protein